MDVRDGYFYRLQNMTNLLTRLLALAELAVEEALQFEYGDPDDRHIWRELQELKPLVQQALAQHEPVGPTDEELLMTYQHAVSNQVESIIQSTGTYAGMDDLAAATLAGLHAVLARFGRPVIEPVPGSEQDA